jgi:hypothetical protein
VSFILYWESLHTHTHCMSWVIYLKFLSIGNFCANWTLFYISTYFWDAIWLIYQLIIHACSEADNRENIFSANFPSIYVFQCEASGLYPLESGLVWFRRSDGQVTCPDARGLVACLCGNVRPDGVPTGLKIAFSPCRRSSFLCHLKVLSLLVRFFRVLSRFLCDFCLFVLFLSIPGILLFILYSSQCF